MTDTLVSALIAGVGVLVSVLFALDSRRHTKEANRIAKEKADEANAIIKATADEANRIARETHDYLVKRDQINFEIQGRFESTSSDTGRTLLQLRVTLVNKGREVQLVGGLAKGGGGSGFPLSPEVRLSTDDPKNPMLLKANRHLHLATQLVNIGNRAAFDQLAGCNLVVVQPECGQALSAPIQPYHEYKSYSQTIRDVE